MWETHSSSKPQKSKGGRTPSDEESQTPFVKGQLTHEGIMLDKILQTVILTLGRMQAFHNIPHREP
ncbi:hypothetical protein D8674_009645 [Pyrus ussuriensis x Pyrus communis]|uniref:Uncharacterized protein n=1 Tax=Pyrus ussuriensis x Pyrus communis TaxID=2448454 RepID=A0A5N5FM67_9ROSA|nr:hypothetical protein D8674_009645 [Pyrus ussuriensis x Pyrus communis]